MPNQPGSHNSVEDHSSSVSLATESESVKPVFTQISLNFNNETRELIAILESSSETKEFDLPILHDYIQRGGFENVELKEHALENLLEAIYAGEFGRYSLGTKPIFVAFRYLYNEKTHKLEACIDAGEIPQEYSVTSLKRKLEEDGLKEYRITDASFEEIFHRIKHRRFGRFPVADKPKYTALRFVLDIESNVLKACLVESSTEVVFNKRVLEAMIERSGYKDFYFESGVLEKLLKSIARHAHGEYEIGNRLDGIIEFELSRDETQAYVSTTAACGGREIDKSFLLEAIASAGIQIKYCNPEAIEEVIDEVSVDKLLIATGKKPVSGEPAKFDPLVDEFVFLNPQANEQGVININDIKEFIVVDENEQLMRRTPATPGTNGYTVKGDAIQAEAGEDIPFDKDLDGAKISTDDTNLLIAETKGHPVIQKYGVRIDKTLVVNNVGTHTGNIDFDGSLLVKGEVMGGLEIKVTGDLIIKDMVHNARLEAGNNIIVNHGVVGSCKKEIGETPLCEAFIRAGGDINARYISMADMQVGGDVDVKEYIAHCKTFAKGSVKLGQSGGKGIISGGECHANIAVCAKVLGTDSGVKTLVSSGKPPRERAQYQQWKELLEERKDSAKKLVNLLKKSELSAKQDSHDESFERKLRNLKIKIVEDAKEIEELCSCIVQYEREKRQSKKSHVSVNSTTYPNVLIDINGAQFTIRQQSKGGRFVMVGEDVRWGNL